MKWTITKNPYNRLVFVGDGENPGYPLFKDCGPSPFNDKCWSDARLIAAAPDMYEACKTVIARITGTNVNTPIKDMSDTWDILKAAINKADGK